MQITSNSAHSPNIFISNGNTPHICSQTHISACICISVHYKVSQTAQLTAGVKNQHTQEKKRLQITSNSAHSPNIFISNGNTPHICSQTHISACICISVHYKVSQTAQLTAGVKNLTHTQKKRLQTTSNSTHSPYMYISIKITSLTCSQTHINACKCISVRHKSACQHPQRSKKTWFFWWQKPYT